MHVRALAIVFVLSLVALPLAAQTPAPPSPPPTPTFPARTCDVKTFGAKGDGSTNDTPAINSAISSCNSAGGGTVNFPSGTYMAASIHLKSNVRLKLQSGATLKARSSGYDAPESNSYDEYQDFGHSHFHNALMWGENISNFAIEGPGKIDGAGLSTGDPSSGGGDKQVSIRVGNTLSFTDLTQTSGGHFYYLLSDCRNITVRNVTLTGGRDGFDFMGCKNVDVGNLTVTGVGDDVCALKNDYALGRRLLTQDIYIHDSTFAGKCNAIQVGSETAGDFRNCHWRNITINQAGKAGIGLQTNDGGILDGFYIDNVKMQKAANPIFINASSRFRTPESVSQGYIQNVYISNVTSSGSTSTNGNEPVNTSAISGYQGTNLRNIVLTNVKITMPGGGTYDQGNLNPVYSPDSNYNPRSLGTRPAYGLFIRDVTGMQLHNVDFDYSSTDLRPAVKAVNTDSLEIDDITAERAASGAWDSIRLSTILDFWLHDSLGFPTVQQASVSSAGYSAGSVTVTPTPTPTPVPGATATPTPTPVPGATATPTPTPVPGGGDGGTWEAEALSPVGSGASTAMQTDANATGGTWLALLADGAGDYLQLTTPSVAAGSYTVSLSYKAHPSRGILQLSVDGVNVGGTLDQYAATAGMASRTFGTVILGGGTHTIRLACTGRNASSAAYTLSADTLTLAGSGSATPTPTPTPTPVPGATPTPTPIPGGGAVSFEAESVTVTTSGTGTTIQSDANCSGGRWLSLDATNTGSWFELTTPSIPAGTYTLRMSYKTNNNRGQLTMRVDGVQLGGTVDQYGSPSTYPTATFGTVTFGSSGTHALRMAVVGKSSSSTSYVLSADKVTFE